MRSFFKNWAENRFFKDLNFGNLQHALQRESHCNTLILLMPMPLKKNFMFKAASYLNLVGFKPFESFEDSWDNASRQKKQLSLFRDYHLLHLANRFVKNDGFIHRACCEFEISDQSSLNLLYSIL